MTSLLFEKRWKFSFALLFLFVYSISGQHSIARVWNEALLHAIRNDFARPTVHARNLFHHSSLMYDIWASYDNTAKPYFLGESVGGFDIPIDDLEIPPEINVALVEAISYGSYRLILHRFQNSPGSETIFNRANFIMDSLGLDRSFISIEYQNGPPAAFGNYVADQIIKYGIQDGSNETNDYANEEYFPYNPAMSPNLPGSQGINDPNHWQPLAFEQFIDQAGNPVLSGVPEFLSPEWGNVIPFSLTENDLSIYSRDGANWIVYNDPGAPPYVDPNGSSEPSEYQWNFSMVAVWASHLDHSDGVMWDISPRSIGNISVEEYPVSPEGYRSFYNFYDGGDLGKGYDLNPITGSSYDPQIVPRGDYARVLAEFWADGPDSETPPGHWFTILNYVNSHPQLVRKFEGKGDVLDQLEWEIKSYFLLGGAMHDAAISAWSIKGFYDYIRPISAIRYMSELGQSSSDTLGNYHLSGMPLHEGFIEIVNEGDPLAGEQNQNVGKIKILTWRGPDFIEDPNTDVAGVQWILAENWWPYQRPTFVTPPFAGYVSGHSTYSRAAAEILTLLTGDPYFPGGIGEFVAKKNEFLVFEDGPSVDVVLQWAKYYDASDQCSLSRIWGGIHPPVDDIPGRLIGRKIGIQAFELGNEYFKGGRILSTPSIDPNSNINVYPNPLNDKHDYRLQINVMNSSLQDEYLIRISSLNGQVVNQYLKSPTHLSSFVLDLSKLSKGIYLLHIYSGTDMLHSSKVVIR